MSSDVSSGHSVTDQSQKNSLDSHKLVLSLFPGVGLLDRAFENVGFCVVRGPDILWGGDVRQFYPPSGVFWGVIGGPPCQDFSGLNRNPGEYGYDMLAEYARVVIEAQPEWWLMENVARVPDVVLPGWSHQRLDINQGWYSDVTRLRHVQFGSKSGRLINVTRQRITGVKQAAALANDNRSFRELCRLQGLPDDYDLPGFLVSEKKRAVGNGVPLQIGMELARAVLDAYSRPVTVQLKLDGQPVQTKTWICGCGRPVTNGSMYAADDTGDTSACRKRAQRKRDRARSRHKISAEV